MASSLLATRRIDTESRLAAALDALNGPPPGAAVLLRGLNARPDLNGQVALVNNKPNKDPQGVLRYPVVAMIDGAVA